MEETSSTNVLLTSKSSLLRLQELACCPRQVLPLPSSSSLELLSLGPLETFPCRHNCDHPNQLDITPLLFRKSVHPVSEGDLLPILNVPKTLRELSAHVNKVTCEQEIVLWRDSHGVAHKGAGVECEGRGHPAGNTGN